MHATYVAQVSGFTSGLVGVGGGLVMLTLLGHSMPRHDAVATAIVAMVPTGMLTSLSSLGAGPLAVRAALLVGATNAIGMHIAAKHLAPHVDEDAMRGIFAAIMLAALIK